MATKAEIVAALKLQYPEVKVGGGEVYEILTPAEYEAIIESWADNVLADEAKAEAALKAETDKATLLAKLGITAEEATLLLS